MSTSNEDIFIGGRLLCIQIKMIMYGLLIDADAISGGLHWWVDQQAGRLAAVEMKTKVQQSLVELGLGLSLVI